VAEEKASRNQRVARSVKNYGRSTFSSLHIRNYRLYFIGQGISMSGLWMHYIALAWLVLELTDSGTILGVVSALQFLPIIFLAPYGGVVADRFDKRKLLFVTQGGMGILALILAILVATDLIRIWMIFIIVAGIGFLYAVDSPTRQAFIHELVGAEELRNAVTLNSVEVNLTRVIGPAIAGVIIAGVGLSPCFFVNAASYSAILICLFLMRPGELKAGMPVPRRRGQLREGLSYVRHTPVLRDSLIIMAIVGTFTYEFQVSLPLIAKYTFDSGSTGLALLTAFMSGGSVVGGLATAGRRKTAPRGLIWTSLAFGASMFLVALSPTLPLAVTAMLLVGACSVVFVSLCNALLQLESVANMRGRVMALWTIAFFGSTTIGGPIIGVIGNHVSPRWTMVVGGLAALGAWAYGLIAMRNYPSRKAPKDLVIEQPTPIEEDAQIL
jgi:MFS family permease